MREYIDNFENVRVKCVEYTRALFLPRVFFFFFFFTLGTNSEFQTRLSTFLRVTINYNPVWKLEAISFGRKLKPMDRELVD